MGTHQVGILRSMTERIGIRFMNNFTATLTTEIATVELQQLVLQDIAEDYDNIIITTASIAEGMGYIVYLNGYNYCYTKTNEPEHNIYVLIVYS